MRGKRGEAGFTLVELLVASAVASLVVGLLSAATFQFLTATEHGHDRLAVLRDHGTAFQWLNRDAQMAVSAEATVLPSSVTLNWTDAVSGTVYESSYAQSGDELVRTLTVDGTPTSQKVARNLDTSGFSASTSGDLLTVSVTSVEGDTTQTRTESVLMRAVGAAGATCIAGDTGFSSPTAQAADTGGDGDGFESSPTNAFADGGGNASNYNGDGDRHRYYDYGISIDSSCVITGIEVRLDWWLSTTLGTDSMSVELSWDGGTSWTTAMTDTQETTSEHTVVLGNSADGWGRTWSEAEFSDANFRVRITSNCSDSISCGLRDFFLDWVPVKVYYGPGSPAGAVSILDAWTTGTTHSVSSGTDRLLLVGVYGEDSGVISSINTVTWGGQTLTEIDEATVGSGYSNLVWMGYLDEAGIAAASGNTIAATWSGSTPDQSVLYAAVTLENVDQTTPVSGSSTGTNTNASTVQTASALAAVERDMAVYVTVSGEQGQTHTADTGYTEGTEEDSGGVGQVASNATKGITAGGTEQPTATWSGTNVRLAIVGGVINVAP